MKNFHPALKKCLRKKNGRTVRQKEKIRLILQAGMCAPSAGKALGIGILGSGFGNAYLSWTKWGAPVLHLQGNFEKQAEKLGITDISVSISHEDGMSIAVVVMEAKS